MSPDYKVRYQTEKTLAQQASKIRNLARRMGRYTIDIVDLIERVLADRLSNTVGFAIVLFDGDKHDEPAFVKFRKSYPKVLLYVRRTVWEDARRGTGFAYFVLAHEIAHILFHDDRAVAFTADATLHIQYAVKETSAEWQADTFAKHLTMPDQVLRDTTDPTLLSILCNVEESTAAERIKSYKRTGPMHDLSYEGNACAKCSNFTLVRNGTETRCDMCGDRVKELALSS